VKKRNPLSPTRIIFLILILLLPLGILFLIRNDHKEYEKAVNLKGDKLSHALDLIEISFSVHNQLISTVAKLASNLDREQQIHEDFLEKAFVSSHSELVYGMGIWYRPYLFQSDSKRFSSYISYSSPKGGNYAFNYYWNSPEYDYHTQEWYLKTINSGHNDMVLTGPYFDTDYNYITLGQPFYRDGIKTGIITIDIILPMLNDFFSQFDFSDLENIYLITDGDKILYTSKNTGDAGQSVKKFNRDSIVNQYRALKFSPLIIEKETQNSFIKIYGIADKNKIIKDLIRSRGYYYGVYILLWGMMLGLLRYNLSVKRKKMENQILNQENTTLKNEIQRRKKAESQLHFFAYHDPVTGLLNLNALLESEIQPVPEEDKRFLIQIWLDNMKELSTILDRNIIDTLLQEFSDRLIRQCPETASQYRGNGFNFYIISRASSEEETLYLAEKLYDEFRKTIRLHSRNVRLRVRIGVTPFKDSTDLNQLLNMSQSTFSGINQKQINHIYLYDTILQQKRSFQLALDAAMSHSSFVSELFLLYQPIVNTEDKSIAGMEALVRWNSSQMEGIISPADFISLAEENGYIIDLGWFVLEESIGILAAKKIPEDWFISVNVSPLQFIESGFTDKLDTLTSLAGINKKQLKLEITESSTSSGVRFFWQTVNELIERGYRLAIDDFGTGESSFHRLHTIPFDTLKIDQSFVKGISQDSSNLEIIQSILRLGNTMNNIVIAEGVETEEIHNLLRSIGMKHTQGYLYSKPIALEDLLKLKLH